MQKQHIDIHMDVETTHVQSIYIKTHILQNYYTVSYSFKMDHSSPAHVSLEALYIYIYVYYL